jgi:hypothetical protein
MQAEDLDNNFPWRQRVTVCAAAKAGGAGAERTNRWVCVCGAQEVSPKLAPQRRIEVLEPHLTVKRVTEVMTILNEPFRTENEPCGALGGLDQLLVMTTMFSNPFSCLSHLLSLNRSQARNRDS